MDLNLDFSRECFGLGYDNEMIYRNKNTNSQEKNQDFIHVNEFIYMIDRTKNDLNLVDDSSSKILSP